MLISVEVETCSKHFLYLRVSRVFSIHFLCDRQVFLLVLQVELSLKGLTRFDRHLHLLRPRLLIDVVRLQHSFIFGVGHIFVKLFKFSLQADGLDRWSKRLQLSEMPSSAQLRSRTRIACCWQLTP